MFGGHLDIVVGEPKTSYLIKKIKVTMLKEN